MVLVVKSLPANAGDLRDTGSIQGSGRSPGGGHGIPLQSSCQENPMDRGAWRAMVHVVTKSRTRLRWLSMHTDRILFRHEKEGNPSICENMDETWGGHAKWNNLERDGKILYVLLYMWDKKKSQTHTEWSKSEWETQIHIYTEFRKTVTMILHAGQQKRHRCKEQTFGLWEKARVGWFGRITLERVYYHM